MKDCRSIDKKLLQGIFLKIEGLCHDLQGDVKKLTNFSPEYRLLAGNYRPYEEFVQIQEELEDYEALKALRDAKVKELTAPTTPLDEVKKQLDIE